MSWSGITLTGDPILVIGFRGPGRRIEAVRVNVDKSVHDALNEVCANALAGIQAGNPVPYTPYIGPQPGEYLTIDATTLVKPAKKPRKNAKNPPPPTQKQETAALVELVARADNLPAMGAGALIKRLEEGFYLQAICRKDGSERIGFVTKAQTRQVMKRSVIPLGKSDSGDRLKKITRPELVLEPAADAVVSLTEVAVLKKLSFEQLVSDTELVVGYVPAQLQRVATALGKRGLTLSTVGRKAVEDKARGSIQIARRLDAFAERIEQIDKSMITSGSGFVASDLKSADFVNNAGELECKPERVRDLLDALEGRFFRDPFSPEKRRADAFRKR